MTITVTEKMIEVMRKMKEGEWWRVSRWIGREGFERTINGSVAYRLVELEWAEMEIRPSKDKNYPETFVRLTEAGIARSNDPEGVPARQAARPLPPEGRFTEMQPEGVTYRNAPHRPSVLVGDDGSVWERLHAAPNPNGYYRVSIGKQRFKGNRKKRAYVHQLVLETFVGERGEGILCRHLDDNPANNHLSNLAYGTKQDNADDRVRNGGGIKGSDQHCAKLHETQIPVIRRLAQQGVPASGIAAKYKVATATIKNVLDGLTWKHVP